MSLLRQNWPMRSFLLSEQDKQNAKIYLENAKEVPFLLSQPRVN